MSDWKVVSRKNPCPACQKSDWCAWSHDGATLKCERTSEPRAGLVKIRDKHGGALFRREGHSTSHVIDDTLRPNLAELQRKFVEALTPDSVAALAVELGVPERSLRAIEVGWANRDGLRRLKAGGAGWKGRYPDGAYSFPERDGAGRIVGFGFRAADGRKGAAASSVGAKRGLIIPSTYAERPDPLLIVEGPSDVAAADALGLAAVGRPANAAGADDLARLLQGRRVLVVGERDAKPDGKWPGREGAKKVASSLSNAWKASVPWVLPPEAVKDFRAWLGALVADGLDLADAEAVARARGAVLASLAGGEVAEEGGSDRPVDRLIQLARERYEFCVNTDGAAFALARDCPGVAIPFGGGRGSIRTQLAFSFFEATGSAPTASALSDALTVLEGAAERSEPVETHLRVARHNDLIVLDLGRTDGRCVVVSADRWQVGPSPVLFRRTRLTSELPLPAQGGSLNLLRSLLNVSDDSWPLVVAYLVGALIPDIPHPVLLLGGHQGAGKSTAARLLASMLDPSPAPLRAQPARPDQWAIATAGAWFVVVDNVSDVPPWWSDALCKAVTGDGWITRRLYTDNDLAVTAYRRVIALTSIDAGALRGDLADRLLRVDLVEIPETERREERELDAAFKAARASILGALLDLLVLVLARAPSITLPARPRMADFARIVAAVDSILGADGLGAYLRQRADLSRDVVDADPVGEAVLRLVASEDYWCGTATELFDRICPQPAPKGWPRRASSFGARLRRLVPDLRAVGVECEFVRDSTRERSRRIELHRPKTSIHGAVRTVQLSDAAHAGPEHASGDRTAGGQPSMVAVGGCPK